MAISRFTSGTYICKECGKRTRFVGMGDVDGEYCLKCAEQMMRYNAHVDNLGSLGHVGEFDTCPACHGNGFVIDQDPPFDELISTEFTGKMEE